MTEAGELRMRAVEEAFLETMRRTEGDGYRGWDPVEVLEQVRPSDGDSSAGFAPISALLLAELVQWQSIGLNLEIFDGEPQYRTAVNDSNVLNVYFELYSRAAVDEPREVESVELFQEALAGAIEDLRLERLELVRVMTVAEDTERRTRLAEINRVASDVERRRPRDELDVGSISWALSGRESAMETWLGPAGWRSNTAIERSTDFDRLNAAGGRLAVATLFAELGGGATFAEISEVVAAETGGFGLTPLA
jgi:hypothetical protein